MCSHISYRRWAGCTAAALMGSTLVVDAQSPSKPRIVIVATGGTIAGAAESTTAAGYKSGAVAVDVLIAAVPQMKKFADVRGVQVASIGSQDMNDEVWLKLASRSERLRRSRTSTASRSRTAPTRWKRPPTSSTWS